MPYEKFVPAKKPAAGKKPPEAKILKGGLISLNDTAYEEYLKGATHIELFYDAGTRKIGLRPKKYGTKAAFKLRAVGRNKSTYRINAKPLMEHYGVQMGAKVSVTPSWNDGEKLLELSL